MFESHDSSRNQILSLYEARKAIGRENVYGPQDIFEVFGVPVAEKPIPVTGEELESLVARAEGETGEDDFDVGQLVLFSEKMRPKSDGNFESFEIPITPASLIKQYSDIFSHSSWYDLLKELAADETPRAQWQILELESIDIGGKNYVDQLQSLRNDFENFLDGVPESSRIGGYRRLIDNFDNARNDLDSKLYAASETLRHGIHLAQGISGIQERKRVALACSELPLNRLLRPNLTEVMTLAVLQSAYDCSLPFEDSLIWTSSVMDDGRIIAVGGKDFQIRAEYPFNEPSDIEGVFTYR